MMNNRTKLYIARLAVITAVCALSVGCQKNSGESIVSGKSSMDKLIEQAQSDSEVSTELSDIIKDASSGNGQDINGELTEAPSDGTREQSTSYGRYAYYAEGYPAQNVNLNIDSYVSIPYSDHMSVYSASRAQITQEFLNSVRSKLVGETQLYDGSVLSQKQDQDALEQSTDEALQTDTQTEHKKYKLTDHPSDGRLSRVGDLYAADSANTYYEWQYSFSADSEICYEVNDGADDAYISLYVQNNPKYGNLLRYRSSKQGYMNVSSVISSATEIYYENGDINLAYLRECSSNVWYDGDNITDHDTDIYKELDENEISPDSLTESDTEHASLSLWEASAIANSFLTGIGLDSDSYELTMSKLICELPHTYKFDNTLSERSTVYRKEYAFRYVRSIDGIQVSNDTTDKFMEEYQGTDYEKRSWCGESMVVYVNDDGVIGFDYISPMEVTETAVENASLKDFDEILDTFIQLAPTVYSNANSVLGRASLNVNKIVLRYSCVSDEDNWESGLIVPVWDFIGTRYDPDTGCTYKNSVIMSINAIDGSVINRTLGY